MDKANDSLLKQLLGIQWYADEAPGDGVEADFRVSLAKEFLRRSALWAKALGHAGEWPFFDVAALAVPGVRAAPDDLAALHAALDGRLSSQHLRWCEWMLHWEAAQRAGVDRPQAPPDPYRPLLRIFERGCSVMRHHGDLLIGAASIPLRARDHWLVETPFVAESAVIADSLTLRSTRKILEVMASSATPLQWPQIVRPVTALGVEVDPPVYGVLKDLLAQGYVAIDTPEMLSNSAFSITPSGLALLARLRVDD